MPDMETMAKLMDYGALIVGYIVLIGIIFYYVTRLAPSLDALRVTVVANQGVMEKLLEGNASAFRELSSSNHNVATALGLLTKTMEQSEGSLQRHEELSQKNFDNAFSGIRSVQRIQQEMQMELSNHVTKCDTRFGRGIHPCD